MMILTKRLSLTAAFVLAAAAAHADGTLTNADGMTLYTFDNDTAGVSTCYDTCAAKWPPYLAAEGDALSEEGWTMVDRTDGTKQWAYDGKPAYLFADDAAAGDMMGDGVGGVWHKIVE
jgi:predicted lipoprotein with Yx(FWY)xxD motif